MVYRVVDQQQRKSKAEREREGGGRWAADLHDSCQLLSTYYSVAIVESQGRRRIRMRE